MSAAYDFTRSGAGGYSIKPSNLFTYVGAGGTLKNLYAAIEGVAEVKLSGDLAISRRAYGRREGIVFTDCTWGEAESIFEAAVWGDDYIQDAYFYLEPITSATPRYTYWFGPYTQPRKETVLDIFKRLFLNSLQSFHYICHDELCTPTRDAMAGACIFQP